MTRGAQGSAFSVEGTLVDIFARRLRPVRLSIRDGRIDRVDDIHTAPSRLIVPPLVDAHVHIESSMVTPAEFGRMALRRGTVASVSDPHEIANVLGEEGVHFMLHSAAKTPFKACFGVPSCVPATSFECAGAVLDSAAVERLLARDDLYYLSEMMNYPGVIYDDPEVHAKISAAHRRGKPVDGHAPGVRGPDLKKYIAAGISTDHESVTADEAREKLDGGMKILIREGSAARNFEALLPVLSEYPDQVCFCSDDKHPDDLLMGHIDALVRRAIAQGVDPFTVLRAASLNPVMHYGLPVGLVRPGDPADFLIVSDLEKFTVEQVYVDGVLVAEHGECLLDRVEEQAVNNFVCAPVTAADLRLPVSEGIHKVRAIQVFDGQIVTGSVTAELTARDGSLSSDPAQDVLKIVVVNRYQPAPPAVGFVKGVGLRRGALASSVAHDSHNIVALGVSDEEIARAVNSVVSSQGGIAVIGESFEEVLSLPVAGLMSLSSGEEVAERYSDMNARAKTLGTDLHAPFMTMSFLALLVIPELKLGDRGLFQVSTFGFVPVILEENDNTRCEV